MGVPGYGARGADGGHLNERATTRRRQYLAPLRRQASIPERGHLRWGECEIGTIAGRPLPA
jgi:hypothetical protein